ncbi:MAG: hypothetical protein QXQ65_06295 [Conexivisphaerales archaeon]
MPYWNTYADRERAPLVKDGLYGINMLQLLFGVKNAKELSGRLESCTDEKYPRVEKLMDEVRVNPELKRQ